jgi:hypothetical protein
MENQGNLERGTPNLLWSILYQYHKKNNLTAILLGRTIQERHGEDSFRNGGQADFLVFTGDRRAGKAHYAN